MPFDSHIAVCDGIVMGHEDEVLPPLRDIIADSVELWSGTPLDGVVMVTNCDKVTPAC